MGGFLAKGGLNQYEETWHRHVRYSTTGESRSENAQPLVINHIKGSFALCHNGNLQYKRPKRRASESHFQVHTDSEVIAYLIAKERIKISSVEDAVLNVKIINALLHHDDADWVVPFECPLIGKRGRLCVCFRIMRIDGSGRGVCKGCFARWLEQLKTTA